jgi:fluoride ion exporter CrcB/FEX
MTAATVSPPRTSPAVRTGLVLAAVLAVGDVVAGITTISGDPVGTSVAVVDGLLALGTLGSIPAAWRGAAWALRTVAITRLLGALTAVPAFFVDDAPAGMVLAAAVTVVVAIVVAVLVLPRGTRS